ncbi:MAG: AMP-binding protein [Firmicutes bacterium]|nr:AMP-binding protein [Bacillota bacterium]
MDTGEWWEQRARAYEWQVPWRYGHQGARWFLGGYSNPVLNMVDRHLEERADQAAVIDQGAGRRLTFRDLYWQSAKLARWWKEQGLAAGERVVLYGVPDMESLLGWLAAARLGAVVVLMPRIRSETRLGQRLLESEARWILGSNEASGGSESSVEEIRRAGRSLPRPIRMMVSTGPVGTGETSITSAIAMADGLLDPVSVEANAVGLLVYGDDPRPYAYAGLGALIGWHEELRELLDLHPGERIGLESHSGGLLHPLILTTQLLTAGAEVVWMEHDWLGAVREYGLTKLLVASREQHRVASVADRLERVVVAGPDWGASMPTGMRAEVIRSVPVMHTGRYIGGREGHSDRGASPAADRTAGGRTGELGAPWAHHPLGEAVHRLEGVSACLVVESDASPEIWVETRRRAEDLLPSLRDIVRGKEGWGGVRIACVEAFPETVEGHLDAEILAAVTRGETRISLERAANPEVVESLIRAHLAGVYLRETSSDAQEVSEG